MTEIFKTHIDGKIAELEAIQYYLSMGYKVFTPVIDNGIDFIICMGNIYQSVQVKMVTSIHTSKRQRFCGIALDPDYVRKIKHGKSLRKFDCDILYFITPFGTFVIPSTMLAKRFLSIQENNHGKYEKYRIS